METQEAEDLFGHIIQSSELLSILLPDSALSTTGGMDGDTFAHQHASDVQNHLTAVLGRRLTSNEAEQIARSFWTYCCKLHHWTETLADQPQDRARASNGFYPRARPRLAVGHHATRLPQAAQP